MKTYCLLTCFFILTLTASSQTSIRATPRWAKFEQNFTSSQTYDNPIYDLKDFHAVFTAPSGRTTKINGFWDGGTSFKVRFAPDEIGEWQYQTVCSDTANTGLHAQQGSFICEANDSDLALYQRGTLIQPKGTYHLAYHDGTPFLWIGCTAWNGGLKSTEEEWDTYLEHRVDHHYNVIQLVTTQWRGGDQNSEGQTAYEYSDELRVNPEFYQHMDGKIDRVNEYGLIAAPVLLWALPSVTGRYLSPGYSLPLEEAVILAKYQVARYGGNQVVWMLGGDGRYAREYEQRWLEIGRRVFADNPPGLVAQHPHGRLWIGDNHAAEDWLDIVGYQSSHSDGQGTVDWINKGEVATRWPHLPARPVINLEPNYEEIRPTIDAEDVRNASYWSLFATPISGITYGANAIWPWIREGESILNHGTPKNLSTWRESMNLPGSLQIGYLAEFLHQYEWWNLRPANELLVDQPGDEQYNHFISVVQSIDKNTVMAYIPHASTLKLYNPSNAEYEATWFNPSDNSTVDAQLKTSTGMIEAASPSETDYILVLQKIDE
ncbi:apiosidase-like domain-containing protein [Tunicatimonas pelagia]|uniref:apiosidase-like domain-containing protein n=1 Tax=Tunicatimonas pelagia TaxID=931531 RepID=UPI0026654319|nr:DUF4038 domain-containing protein [Tunicatimonas pelagia]WKN42959.1 DUF4038 domain-containing protein [Tunicatimonas pelagia]